MRPIKVNKQNFVSYPRSFSMCPVLVTHPSPFKYNHCADFDNNHSLVPYSFLPQNFILFFLFNLIFSVSLYLQVPPSSLFFTIYLLKNMGCLIVESLKVQIFLIEDAVCDLTCPSVFLQIGCSAPRFEWTQVPCFCKTICRVSMESSQELSHSYPFSPCSVPCTLTYSQQGRSPPIPSCYLKLALRNFKLDNLGFSGSQVCKISPCFLPYRH